MSKKIILYNGPRLCGKNASMDYLSDKGYEFEVAECKGHLHKLTMGFFCVPEQRYWAIYNNRDLKEVPQPEFKVRFTGRELTQMQELLGEWFTSYDVELSIREAMIYVSECIVKPRFGNDYFGRARMTQIRNSSSKLFVDSSTGFPDELNPLIHPMGLGQKNILLLRIHREGCTFEGDSRSYIPDGIIDNTVDVYNNGTELEYFLKVEEIVNDFLNK